MQLTGTSLLALNIQRMLMRTARMCLRLLLCSSQWLSAQNLIPNGGFETVGACPVQMPENGVVATQPWYVIGDPRFVTPDLFHRACPLSSQRAAASQFWGTQFLPYAGDGFMGLGSAVLVNGVFVSEGAGTPLEAPLQAGKAYYVEMQIRSKGLDHVDNPATQDCRTAPQKFIGIYLSDDSIRQTREIRNQIITNTFASGRLAAADSSQPISSVMMTDWHRYSNCFIAAGGESHLGITGPLGRFRSAAASCTVAAQQIGFFHQSYYDIDEVRLLEMPLEMTADAVICEAEPTPVHLRRLVPMPMFDQALFRWADGSTDSVRVLRQEGVYPVEVIMPCTVIPLYVTAVSTDCATRIYVPTGFSPNGDGINDEFGPVVRAYWDLSWYQFSIYDRWGNRVFAAQDPSARWNGDNAAAGVYIWSVEYQVQNGRNSGRNVKSGTVTLLR
ncbi:MAG: gliding motility-associated C-terminal domain-containing protein [Bacteroidia bacterium]|nr:gliding motility-associated C-terminal domain-containing protein [Bacteroidia bacterium]